MRDRRNTNLSVSSTDSACSVSSKTCQSNNVNEKKRSSPPPSPTLPAPATRKNRPRSTLLTGHTATRALAAICGTLILLRCCLGIRTQIPEWTPPTDAPHAALVSETERVSENLLPDEPTALIVTGPDGSSKWTVSMPHDCAFPLSGHEYRRLCALGDSSRHAIASTSRHAHNRHWWKLQKTSSVDRTFLDVSDAEQAGVLPKPEDQNLDGVCETSLTFVLDAEDASFGTSLLQLWMSYGIAKREGRAFFIDDSHWAWGKYTSYFLPPPEPKCARPPPHYIVPCPHNARHLVVSSATAPWTFKRDFERHPPRYGRPPASFDLLRTGYDDLFHLVGEDAQYAASRIAHLKKEQEDGASSSSSVAVIGMHIRRGDLHPFEYQYSKDYLPLERYAEAARSLLISVADGSSGGGALPQKSQLILASDDPAVLTSPEFSLFPLRVQRAQERIQLATKDTLDLTSPVRDVHEPGSAYVKHVDENSGWEGGFYAGLFFALGGGGDSNGDAPGAGVGAGDAAGNGGMQVREYVGRAYLMDLAVLGKGDGVVCAVSSATCRVLRVMMGWDEVQLQEEEGGVRGRPAPRWVNVDRGGRGWSWDGR